MNAKIFINYRRQESSWNSVALYEELIDHFPEQNVFKDFNTIEPGSDFVFKIQEALKACDVLLVLMGPKWLQIKDDDGNQRIFQEDDFVRIEIATALERKITVIPILFDNAKMPSSQQLPDDLKALSRRQSIAIDMMRFKGDTARLVEAIKKCLPEELPPPPPLESVKDIAGSGNANGGKKSRILLFTKNQSGFSCALLLLLPLIVVATVFYLYNPFHSLAVAGEQTASVDSAFSSRDTSNKIHDVAVTLPAHTVPLHDFPAADTPTHSKENTSAQPENKDNTKTSENTSLPADGYTHYPNFPVAYMSMFRAAQTYFSTVKGQALANNTAAVQNYKPMIVIDDNSADPSNIFPHNNEWAFRFVMEGNKANEPEKYQSLDNLIQSVFTKSGIPFSKSILSFRPGEFPEPSYQYTGAAYRVELTRAVFGQTYSDEVIIYHSQSMMKVHPFLRKK